MKRRLVTLLLGATLALGLLSACGQGATDGTDDLASPADTLASPAGDLASPEASP